MNDNVVDHPSKDKGNFNTAHSVALEHIRLVNNFQIARDVLDIAATDYTNAKVALQEFQLQHGIFLDDEDDE